jgi:hypothetical protein
MMPTLPSYQNQTTTIQKRKLEAKLPQEQMQNIIKPNSATYLKLRITVTAVWT